MDRRYRRATSAIIVLLVLRFLARQLINYCFRAAATAATLETPGALFAQRGLEERWVRLVQNYDSYSARKMKDDK